MTKENQDKRRIYAGLKDLHLPDGRRWCGDENWGFPEEDHKLPKPELSDCKASTAGSGESDLELVENIR